MFLGKTAVEAWRKRWTVWKQQKEATQHEQVGS